MAVLTKILIGACALASVVQAHPIVLTVTDIVTVTTWETLNTTTTVWKPLSESPVATTTSSVPSISSSEAFTTPTTSVVPVQLAPAPSTSTLSTTTTTTTTTTPVIQIQQVATPSPSTSQAPTSAPQQPTTTLQTLTTTTGAAPRSAEAATSSATAAAGNFASTSGGSCEGSGSACTGDVTHWDGGLGACGWNVNTASDMQIALPVGMMGSQSNGNPYCGRSVTLKNPTSGTTVQATVGDKCMGCTGASIDCTDVLFSAITDGTGDGRVSGMEWWFN